MKEIPNELTINGEVYVRQTMAKEPKVKPWPQEGDDVWIQFDDGTVNRYQYNPKDSWQLGCLHQGRIHRTEAEAIRANEVEAANAVIKRWRDENAPFVADWGDSQQRKYYAVYRHDDKRWSDSWTGVGEVLGLIYFATDADLVRCHSELPHAWAALVGRVK